MFPHFLLRDVEWHKFQCARRAGVAAAKVGRDETFHTRSGSGICESDLEIIIGAGEGDDDSVLTLEGSGEFFGREVIGYADFVD